MKRKSNYLIFLVISITIFICLIQHSIVAQAESVSTISLIEQQENNTIEDNQEGNEYDPLYTIQALNLAIMSLNTIIDTQDRTVLDTEYRRVINNLKLGSIEDDDELIDAYREIMDFITRRTLSIEERERLQAKLEKAKSRAFFRSAAGIRAYGASPVSFALSLVTSVASAAFNYYEQKEVLGEEFSDAMWEDKKEDMEELNEMHKTFLSSAWRLLRKYTVSDDMRLNEDSIKIYFTILKEKDNEKALRMFESVKRHFDAYPTFYYYYANRALKAGHTDLAKQCFEEFETRWRDILRPDPLMASVAVTMLAFIDFSNEPEKAEKYIALAEKNLRDNDDGSLRFGIAAAKYALGKAEEAGKLLQHNLDFDMAVTESQMALRNIGESRPILEGIEDRQYLVYDFDQISSVEDQQKAFEAYKKMTEQGDAEAQFRLGKCYGGGSGVEKNEKQSVEWYRKAAEQGHLKAQNNLGWCYLNGTGVEKDEKQAVEWYRKAAEQGLAIAQSSLGVCYQNGTGVEKDEKKAVEWYRKAAEQGESMAQNDLGVCYVNGTGVEKDEKQAVEWYRKAAEQGLATAQNNLGECYGNGTGVEKDEKQAVEWFRKAAEQGLATAQTNLGVCYQDGTSVEKDEKQAVEWYQKAAEQGLAIALCNLGVCYLNGTGVEKDEKQAVEWFRKAAEQGLAIAQYNLGLCYEYGWGVEKDERLANEWYNKAAEQGDQDAKKRQESWLRWLWNL